MHPLVLWGADVGRYPVACRLSGNTFLVSRDTGSGCLLDIRHIIAKYCLIEWDDSSIQHLVACHISGGRPLVDWNTSLSFERFGLSAGSLRREPTGGACMDFRLDVRLSSGLAYLLTTAALILSLFWYSDELLIWTYAGTAATLVCIGAAYMVRSRFVVVHALHALILLVIQVLWWRLLPMALDFPVILTILTVFSMKNALQGYCMDWWFLNLLKRWLMPRDLA